jgi:hypothetical protein
MALKQSEEEASGLYLNDKGLAANAIQNVWFTASILWN